MLGPKVYLAGPFFTPEQDKLIDEIDRTLTAWDYEVSSPKTYLRLSKNSPPEEISRCFRLNCEKMDEADWVFAVVDDYDTGTIWEAGYMFRAGKPIVWYSDVPGRTLNVMLAEGAYSFINGLANISVDDLNKPLKWHGNVV